MSKFYIALVLTAFLLIGPATSRAASQLDNQPREQVSVDMYAITPDGDGAKIGTVVMHDSGAGLVLIANIDKLTPGQHGFHVHENPDCDPGVENNQKVAGFTAGNHYDPDKKAMHMGPEGSGHRGDLPVLIADAKGNVNQVVLAPHLKLTDVRERSLVIHENGDNYSDTPKPVGGSGKRIACAVVY